MSKKGINLGDMIDTATTPTDTGVPQRGAGRRKAPKPERRTDQMSIRVKPSTRSLIERLAEEEGVPIAEVFERAIKTYAKDA